MTNILFNDIKVGDKIEIRGPLGRFNLPDNVENDLVLICTGTGLAPFRSILQSIVLNNISHHKIYLIFGTRTYQDLLCFDEMKEYENKLKNFKYIPVLSREDWEGESGYVHNQYIDFIKSKKLKDPIFYLCGWRDMIKEARNNLKELGFDSKNQIRDLRMKYKIKHECGIAFLRLRKPLQYFLDKYKNPSFAANKMFLMMHKQRNRGQDGSGVASLKLNTQPGSRYI